jgi:zinc/manganese transport system permease protein
MIGAPAAARSFTDRPGRALFLSVSLALATVWAAIALSYSTNYPVGFFVGSSAAVLYALGRAWAALGRRRGAAVTPAPDAPYAIHPPERHTILT